jgi:hypothetical protein
LLGGDFGAISESSGGLESSGRSRGGRTRDAAQVSLSQTASRMTSRLAAQPTTLPSDLGNVDFPLTMGTYLIPKDTSKNPREQKNCLYNNCRSCCFCLRFACRISTDCCSCAHNTQKIYRETKSKVFWLFMILAVLYGFTNWLRAAGWDLSIIGTQPSRPLFFLQIARASGALMTIGTMILLVAMNKIVTNSFNELPNYRRAWFFWRKAHKGFAAIVIFMGLVHTIAHHFRQYFSYTNCGEPCELAAATGSLPLYDPPTLQGYETWETITGYGLWFCLLGLSSHHILLAAPRFFCKPRREGFPMDQKAKVIFRKYHFPLYVVYTILYTLHCYNLWPVLFLIMYQLSYYAYKLPLTSGMYCFNVKGARTHYTTSTEYDLELWFQLAHDIPSQFGLYCQVCVDNVNASYTVIPDEESNNIIHFKIRRCVLTEKFRKMIGADFKNMHYMGGGDRNNIDPNSGAAKQTNISTFECVNYNMRVYGPFHSSDLELDNSKKLAVLTTGIGGTVAYSTIAYARGRPGHWDNLCIVHYDKNFKHRDEAIRMGISVDDAKNAVVQCNNMKELINFAEFGHNTDQPQVQNGGHTRPTFISLEGRVHANFTRELVSGLHEQGFDFLICSRIWTGLIEACNEDPNTPPFKGSVIKSLHFEEFE